jgi:hypothetical protein
LTGKPSQRLAQRRWTADDHQRGARRSRITGGAVGLAQATPRPIALHGVLDLPAHRESGARRFGTLTPEHDEGGAVDALASLEERLELGAGGQPLAPGKAAP